MTHQLTLTEKGQELARRLSKQLSKTQHLYPRGVYHPTTDAWTVGNDVLYVVGGFYDGDLVRAPGRGYVRQRTALVRRFKMLGLCRAELEVRVGFREAVVGGWLEVAETNPPTLLYEATPVLEAVGSETRAAIISILQTLGPCELTRLATLFGAPRATVYYHLVQLRDTGVVHAEKDGAVTWALNPYTFDALCHVLGKLTSFADTDESVVDFS